MDYSTPTRPSVEHFDGDIIGIGTPCPRVSWASLGSASCWYQEAFELEIGWQDGRTEIHAANSPESCLVPWPWRPLVSFEAVSLRVRVRGTSDQHFSGWSTKTRIEAGLLRHSDWTCSLIQPEYSSFDLSRRPIAFSKVFHTNTGISRARLYISSHGVYEAKINERVVGDHVLAPGWTSYKHRLIYQTFDISAHMDSLDAKLLEIVVAEGWFCGRLGFLGGRKDIYGDTLGAIALIRIDYQDGTQQVIPTDDTWSWNTTFITNTSIYDGEAADYSSPHAISTKAAVRCVQPPKSLCAPESPPIRRVEELKIVRVMQSPSGKTILDFGQNFVGRIRATIDGPKGLTVSFQHAEVLENGELSMRPLREAKACDSITLSGHGRTEWEPVFTFHGFRYVQVDGWPGALDPEHIRGIVVHTDMSRTGCFQCSNPMLNKLHENVVWSMRGNFVSLPTDCPQRDERLGWTGDINVFSDTANYLYNARGLLSSWLKDLSCEQDEYCGIVPLTVPNVIPALGEEAHAIWGDVAIALPWSLYQASGDRELLRCQMRSMVSWLDSIPRRSNGLWNYTSDWKLGDWLDPLAPPQDPGNSRTDPDLVSDVFLVHSLELMTKICQLLNDENAEVYLEESRRVRRAFIHEYVAPSGRVAGDSQTAYALVLYFSLLNKGQRQHAMKRLEELIRRGSRFRIATGFAGTPYLGHALSGVGKSNLFYRMLLHRECPSWLYPVSMGSTTIWERWDSMLPDGSINPGEMTSFNHYALGSVVSWMYRVILGLYPVTPGWGDFAVQPVPGGGLRWAKGSFRSSYGICNVFWEVQTNNAVVEKTPDIFTLRINVPLNTTAHVTIPGSNAVHKRGSGAHTWSVPFLQDEWPPRALYPPFSTDNDALPVDSVMEVPDVDKTTTLAI